MSLLLPRAAILKRSTLAKSSGTRSVSLKTHSTPKSVSKPLSSSYTTKRSYFASSYLNSKMEEEAIIYALKHANRDSVRQAYKARKKNSAQQFEYKKVDTKPETSDMMEDILNAALPDRKKSTGPEFGDLESYKKHASQDRTTMSLADLMAAEAEEDRGYVGARKAEEGEETWDGFGGKAQVKVPAEVFELNAHAQFSFLKEEYHEAQEYLEQSLALIHSRLGHKHNEAATVMVSLALVHEKLKQFDEAERHLKEAIHIRESIDGSDHTSVAIALNKLAHVQTCKKNFEGAVESSKKALKIMENAVAVNEHEMQYYRSHQMDMPQELEGRRRALKTENGQILNTRGAIHFKKGDKAAALKDWQAAVDVWAELLPQTDSLANPLFAVHRNIVHLYKQSNEQEEAVATAKQFIALLERHQPKSPHLPSAHLFLSQVYEHFRQWNEAWKAAEGATKASFDIHGSCEETDELKEAAHLLGIRAKKMMEGI